MKEKCSDKGENGYIQYNRIVVPSILHGDEIWEKNARLRKKMDALGISCLCV